MVASVRWLMLTIFACLWIHICSHIQFDEFPQTTACDGYVANLIWKYTSNESISSVQWHRIGSPDVLMADILFGFTPQGVYVNRVTQAAALGNAAITISSVTAADNGTYKCSVNTINVKRGYLIVAEAPSSLPYFNKTATSLTCNPPQNEGTPKVQTVLKTDEGNTLSVLTVHSSGTYQCCILGDAVKCLASTSNSSTEVCVNETYNVETTTATTTNGSDNGSGLSGGAIAGIVIAVVFVCGVVVCVIAIVIFKKKKNKDTAWYKKDITKDETRNSPTLALRKSGVDVQILPSPSDTPRRLQPITIVTNIQEEKPYYSRYTFRKLPPLLTIDQEEKPKIKKKKKKKKKKEAKQEQNQQQQEGKDNTAF